VAIRRRAVRTPAATGVPFGPHAQIESRILLVRGQRVLLDADLARLYGVGTGRLNEQVKRNRGRFPADFMFQLTKQEVAALRSQFAISNAAPGRGGRRYSPLAFTEHGAIMAATVLSSQRAIDMSLHVVRAFVRLRDVITANKALAAKLEELEERLATHDQAIGDLVKAIRALAVGPEPVRKRRIGFIQSD
jgi:ORF6N domain